MITAIRIRQHWTFSERIKFKRTFALVQTEVASVKETDKKKLTKRIVRTVPN